MATLSRRLQRAPLLLAMSTVTIVGIAGPSDAAFPVTINPEARVSVQRIGRAPIGPCNDAIELGIRIVNQSSSHAALGVQILSRGAELVRGPERNLSGAETEILTIAVRLTLPPPVDLTLAFDAGQEMRLGIDGLGEQRQRVLPPR